MSEATSPPRRLEDKVLQSAQEAVLTDPLDPAVPRQATVDKAESTRYRRRNHVACHPLAAALAAACAGALAMVALRAVIQSRRHANEVPARQ